MTVKLVLLLALLGLSTGLSGFTIFSQTSRRLVLGWLAVGLCQSAFLLVVGFELLCLLNLLFVVASTTVLQLYGALFGTGAIHAAEKTRTRQDWIYGLGTGATLAAILCFALISTFPEVPLTGDLESAAFSKEILTGFLELPWIIGFTLFLSIVVWAAVGRPGWKSSQKERT